MAKEYMFTFVVRPRGSLLLRFPIDMLRYDGCYPATENDSAKIYSTFDRKPEPKNIVLKKFVHANRSWQPTEGRWQSFGWEVVPSVFIIGDSLD